MPIPDEKRRICADSALKCFGTAYIFERRARPIRLALRWLAFLGIAGPAALGGVVAAFNLKQEYIALAVTIAGAIAALQVVISIWSLVASWDASLSYAIESKAANYRLADEFSKLGQTTSLSPEQFDTELGLLETQSDFRADLDNRVDISDKEKRMGMRAGLRRYSRPCAGCGEVPKSLDSTSCPVCGQFS